MHLSDTRPPAFSPGMGCGGAKPAQVPPGVQEFLIALGSACNVRELKAESLKAFEVLRIHVAGALLRRCKAEVQRFLLDRAFVKRHNKS